MIDALVMNLPLKFVSHKIEEYAMQVTYDPRDGTGRFVYNLSLIDTKDLEKAIAVYKDAFKAGVCVSGLVRFVPGGEEVEDFPVPKGKTGIVTVCSTTLDGILMHRGVPLNPIGGGVVEIEQRIPRRFTHLILYQHTTIDPLQVLISQEITSITDVMRKGSGTILANIRECHMEAEHLVGQVLDDLTGSPFTGILDIGPPNSPALGVQVSPQYMGIVALGGTNPMAAIRESGIEVTIHAIKGLLDIGTMSEVLDY
jgi:global nitrogen regulator NrpRII